MRKNTIFLSILAVLVGGGFVYGIAALLILRYEAGDIYPPYSSLRADPLGLKAFYEGIANTPGLAAVRNYQPLRKLKDVNQTTVFYVGMEISDFLGMDQTTAQTFEDLVSQGNRVIIAFTPVYQEPAAGNFLQEEPKAAPKKDEPKEAEKKPPLQDKTESAKLFSLTGRWGVKFGYSGLSIAKNNVYQPIQALKQGDSALPAKLSWHTALYFEPSERERWQVIYAANRRPVIIEKDIGKGTLVFAADSYFCSNEAMRQERHSELLAWLIGPNVTVVFDETHFGVQESPGVATLLRKYRLGGFVAALVFLALLFVWKNALSFVPPYADTLPEKGKPGKDVTTGLINLLRQNISDREILPVCFEEWQKSVTHGRQESGEAIAQIRAVIQAENARPARERDPVKCYQTISNMLRSTKS